MHDVFEGVAVVEIKCMLVMFIQEQKIFNSSTLNSCIKSFPFGFPDAKSKPLPFPLLFYLLLLLML